MKFKIEQIAICPLDVEAAINLLKDIGAEDWTKDEVIAEGKTFGQKTINKAKLLFNYDLIQGKEFEILEYTFGKNWIEHEKRGRCSVSHFGMHCSAEDLKGWMEFFEKRNIKIAQEVLTKSHTNPAIAGKRSYRYVIFDTKEILGVDLKFIVRRDIQE